MQTPAVVELGVGNGEYCKGLVRNSKGPVWAYDTFDGEFPLQTVGIGETADIYATCVVPSNSSVRSALEALGVKCVTGVFPETFHSEHPESVSFVHVDMDTYMATKAALELFHPLMEVGGSFMVHDYDNNGMPGVKRAVDEFAVSILGTYYRHNNNHDSHYLMTRIST